MTTGEMMNARPVLSSERAAHDY